MGLFTNLEILIMVSVVGFLVFVILILSILELFSKKKETKDEILETEEVKEENTEVTEVEVTENSSSKVETEVLEEDNNRNLNEEVITLETLEEDVNTMTTNQVEALVEDSVDIQPAMEEIMPNVEEIKPQTMIEKLKPAEEEIEVLELEPEPEAKAYQELEKIKEELEHPVSLEETISNLEAIEEESAIISYQELLSVTEEMQALPEDMGDEPISITEVYEKFTGERMESPSIEDIYEASIKSGIETENLNEIQLENTANLEKLDKEIRKTNKVLNMLNELKKNFD